MRVKLANYRYRNCISQMEFQPHSTTSSFLFRLISFENRSVFAGEYSFSSPSLDWPSAVDVMEASDASLTTNVATSTQEPQAQKRRPIRAIRRAAGRALGVIPRLFHLSF